MVRSVSGFQVHCCFVLAAFNPAVRRDQASSFFQG
jgi:hypothetical protein